MKAEQGGRSPLPSPVSGTPAADPEGDDLITPEEAVALVHASSPRAPTGLRNRALVAVMYRSGLRPGEALALTPGDVDLRAGAVTVPARKGGRPRVTGIDATTRRMIAAWAERRAERGIGDEAPLFCTLAGAPIKAAYVRELLPRLARRAGIRTRVHPLALRYANAAELAEEGVPASVIDRHLGVAPAAAARRMRRPVRDEDVIDALASRGWQL